MNAKEKKFADKGYKMLEDATEEFDDGYSLKYAGKDELVYYLVDVVLTKDPEEGNYFCSAEFLKVKLADLEYKAYQKAKKEFDKQVKEAEDSGEDLDDVEMNFPEFDKAEWDGMDPLDRFNALEDYLDYGATDLNIEEEKLDKFLAKMKELGIDVPADILESLG